jgi:hypothetical protein
MIAMFASIAWTATIAAAWRALSRVHWSSFGPSVTYAFFALAMVVVAPSIATPKKSARGVEFMRRYREVDARLVAKGFPPTSKWWLETLERFYARSPSSVRTLIARVGRRGGKSSTMCRVAVVEALYGGHVVPPGDVGFAMFVSTTRDEASSRLRTIDAILRALGFTDAQMRRSSDAIELSDRRVGFKLFTATISGVSGATAIMLVCDEAAKWKDAETGANPAREVLASAAPSLATMPHARRFIVSSPFGVHDAHYELFERGDTSDQRVAYSPSWGANPTLSEAGTHALEPSERIWSREFLAVPGSSESAFLDRASLARCVDVGVRNRPPVAGVHYVGSMDAGFRDDSFAVSFCHREMRASVGGPPRDVIVLDAIYAWAPAPGRRLDFDEMMNHVAELAALYNDALIFRDSFSGDAVASALRTRGTRSEEVSMSAPEQMTRWTFLESIVRSGRLRLVDDPDLVRELSELRLRLRASGVASVAVPERRGHDDRADAVCLSVFAVRTAVPAGDVTVETSLHWEPGIGLDVESRWFQVSPGGRRTPIDAPAGTFAAEIGREARQYEGCVSPSDPEWHRAVTPTEYAEHLRRTQRTVLGLDDPRGIPVIDHD